jgi:hypothetical protein
MVKGEKQVDKKPLIGVGSSLQSLYSRQHWKRGQVKERV